jgi:hypothetical protein
MFDGAPGIGFGFEHGDWSDELSSFRIAAVRLSFPPAVHKYKPFFFRWPGFNPAVLIRVSSSSQYFVSSCDHEESCGATLLAFAEELTPVLNNASKSEGLKNQRLPSRVPGIFPSRAMRFTVFGCSRRNRAASMQSQTGSIVAVAIFIEHFLSNTVRKIFLAAHPPRRKPRRENFIQ